VGVALRSNTMSLSTLSCGCRSLNHNIVSASSWHSRSLTSSANTKSKRDIDNEVTQNLQDVRKGDFKSVTHPEKLSHFKTQATQEWEQKTRLPGEKHVGAKVDEPPMGAVALPHPIWTEEELHNVEITHKKPKGFVDHLAYYSVKLLRGSFDVLSGYNKGTRTERKWLNRIIFLETVAGVPGMVAAMVRHLNSLRKMRRDHGWIHTMLEEAENERMHLMTALNLKNPSWLFRMCVVSAQGVFVSFFSLAYMISPRYCHRFVGYLEEEAVVTYSKLLKDIDGGPMNHWNTLPAPPVAISYWQLPEDATMYNVVLAIRADEAHHRVVNHTLGSMKKDDYNPYKPGE